MYYNRKQNDVTKVTKIDIFLSLSKWMIKKSN